MRLRDIRDYAILRKTVINAGEVLSFRKGQRPGTDIEVHFKDRRRLLLRGGHGDYHIFDRIFLHDTYHIEDLTLPLDCVLDIGANTGVFACRMLPHAERVICYEPSSANFGALERNLGTDSRASAHQAAVAGNAGMLRLYSPDSIRCSGQFSIFQEVDGFRWREYEEVRAKTLGDVFREHAITHCGLLKLDVEGAEYEILYAADQELLRAIGRICGEYHQHDQPSATANIESLAQYLEASGFVVELCPDKRRPGHGRFFARRNETL